jgi:hypothetical protein
LHGALSDLGAVHPMDLLDLDDEDVASLGMKKLELKRWNTAMEDLRIEAKNKGPPPSPMRYIPPKQSEDVIGGGGGGGQSSPPQNIEELEYDRNAGSPDAFAGNISPFDK